MPEPKAGARVWVRCEGSIQRGTVSTVRHRDGQLAGDDAGVTIVLDGGATVVATTVAQRGNSWDFDNEAATRGTT